MGGLGSGRRPSYAGKDKTEDSLPLDIRRLARAGVLSPGRSASWQWTVNDRVQASIGIRAAEGHIVLSYSYSPQERPAEAINQTIWMETTPCTLGGHRRWFTCPTCAKRVALLYGAGRLFACRQCKRLAYASQSEADDDRATRRADRIRKRLGWPAGILNGPGGRPRGMRTATFERLFAEHEAFVAKALAGMQQRLGLIKGMLTDTRKHMASW